MSELPAPHTWRAPAHDPLCRQQHWEGGDCFDCRLITKVRAEYEGEREAWEETMRRYVNGVLADLRAKVDALPWIVSTAPAEGFVLRADVLALLDGFPPHEHTGDAYDPTHCVYTRADGERCGVPIRSGG